METSEEPTSNSKSVRIFANINTNLASFVNGCVRETNLRGSFLWCYTEVVSSVTRFGLDPTGASPKLTYELSHMDSHGSDRDVAVLFRISIRHYHI